MTDDYANMKTDEMNALNAFGCIGMSLMQLNVFGFIQVNGEPDNEINVFQHMFAMTCIMKNINACSVAYVMLKASEDNNSYNGYLHADFNHVNGYQSCERTPHFRAAVNHTHNQNSLYGAFNQELYDIFKSSFALSKMI